MRHKARTRAVALSALALLAGAATAACGGDDTARAAAAASAAPTSASENEIAGLFTGWNSALATLDAEKVADRYAPDAVLLPTVSNKVRTDRAGIIDYFIHFLENKPQGVILESHVDVLDEDTAVDAGVYRFTLHTGEGKSEVEARYTFVYELRGGQWLIVNHHSSAMPE